MQRRAGERIRLSDIRPESRLARTEALLLLLRASVLVFGGLSLLLVPGAATVPTPSPVPAVVAQCAIGLALLLLIPVVSRLGASTASVVARLLAVGDVIIYAGLALAFHHDPGGGGAYALVALLVGPSRWGWRGLAGTALPTVVVATLLPQVGATGAVVAPLTTVVLCLVFTTPALVIGALVRRGSARLRMAQEQFRTAFEHASLGMLLLDAAGVVLEANHAIASLCGYPGQELVGRPFADCAVPEQRSGLQSALDGLSERRPGLRVEVELLRGDGQRRWGLVAASWLAGASGVAPQVVLQVENVTDRKRAEAQLSHQATHDELTGLPNRSLLRARLEGALSRQESVALIFLDLDRFKVVNDGLGHSVGDQLLQAVGARLSAAIRPGDLVARLGGDEFVVLCQPAASEVDALQLAGRLLQCLEPSFSVGGGVEVVRASMGLVVAAPGDDADGLLRDADTAMYRSKAGGGARVTVFTPELRDAAVRLHELEVELRQAIEEEDIRVEYQPVVDLTSGRITGVEALARWDNGARGPVAPVEFIHLAEQSDLVLALGTVVLRKALRDLGTWQAPALQLAVNVSVRQLADPAFPLQLSVLIEEAGVRAGQLCLEVTETALASDVAGLIVNLQALRDLGVTLAIDDFGTGHASLTYLAQFPVDVVKVDRSFVDGLGDEAGNAAIVGGVVAMAHTFGMRVVAEGAETREQVDALRRLGCDHVQGFAIARPMPATELAARLAAGLALIPSPRGELRAAAEGYDPARRYRLLLDATRTLTAVRGVTEALDGCFSSLRQVMSFTGGSILVVDDGQVRIAAAAPTPTPEALAGRIPLGQGISGAIAATGSPHYLPDVSVAAAVSPHRRAVTSSSGVRSWYGVPLIAGGETIGVLQLDSTEVDAFDEQDRLLVLAFAPVVAVAVQRALDREAALSASR